MSWHWSMRNPDGGMNGFEFANATTAEDQRLVLVHAAPKKLEIVLRDEKGEQIASGTLRRDGERTPMTAVRLEDTGFARDDLWPDAEHIGCVVILPGGEAGILRSWEHAEDRSSWRWTLELSNHT